MRKILENWQDNIKWENVPLCPVCSAPGNLHKIVTLSGVSVSTDKCINCGLIYHNPRMTKDSLDYFYSSGIYRDVFGGKDCHEEDRAVRLVDQMAKRGIQPFKALDLGAGRGYLLQILEREYGTDIYGVDLNKEYAYVEVVRTKDELPQGKYDLISGIHYLEHVYDPLNELYWMVDHLTKTGWILLEVPFPHNLSLPHPFEFSMPALEILLNKVGLTHESTIHKKNHTIFARRFR